MPAKLKRCLMMIQAMGFWPGGCFRLILTSVCVSAAGMLLAVPGEVDGQVVLPTFPETNGTVFATALYGNTLYVGGDFSKINPVHANALPIDASTALAKPGFPVVTGLVQVAIPDGSGGWYIGGGFTSVGGLARSGLAHILSDMTVSTWNPSPNGQITALARSGSTIYAVGQFSQISGIPRSGIAAVDAETGSATSWVAHPALPVNIS